MIIAGNRMPVALFLLMMFLYLLVEKDFRKYFLPLLVIVCTIFLFLLTLIQILKITMEVFIQNYFNLNTY